MNKDALMNKWSRICINLYYDLEDLKKLEKEKEEIIAMAEQNGINEQIQKLMNDSIKKYQIIEEETASLKQQSEDIRNQLRQYVEDNELDKLHDQIIRYAKLHRKM